MSGDVGKILEVAAVAAAAYFTAGGSLAASGAAADTIGAAGYGGAALGGISDVAGGALYTAPAAAGFGGAATAGTIGAGLAADGATGIGTGLAADGTFSDAGTLAASNVAPALTGTVTSPYSTPTTGLIGNVTPASGITNSSALDWLSGHKGQALGAGKILAALYAMQGPSAQQRALLAQMNQNSQSLQQIPASQANLTDAQLQAIERSEAAGGYLGSGKMMADIASGALGQQLQVQQYNNGVASAKQALLAQQLMN